jgi:hypothetical protein
VLGGGDTSLLGADSVSGIDLGLNGGIALPAPPADPSAILPLGATIWALPRVRLVGLVAIVPPGPVYAGAEYGLRATWATDAGAPYDPVTQRVWLTVDGTTRVLAYPAPPGAQYVIVREGLGIYRIDFSPAGSSSLVAWEWDSTALGEAAVVAGSATVLVSAFQPLVTTSGAVVFSDAPTVTPTTGLVGTMFRLANTYHDVAGNLADPSAVQLDVLMPGAQTTTFRTTDGTLARVGQGLYAVSVLPMSAGVVRYRWSLPRAPQALGEEGSFVVSPLANVAVEVTAAPTFARIDAAFSPSPIAYGNTGRLTIVLRDVTGHAIDAQAITLTMAFPPRFGQPSVVTKQLADMSRDDSGAYFLPFAKVDWIGSMSWVASAAASGTTLAAAGSVLATATP